jgi:glycosyltransferase involved in cell wall biosynthesis
MKIVIFQPMLKFYRVPLFEHMHKLLSDEGHEVHLVFGTPWKEELKRNDNVVLENEYCFFEKSHWYFDNKVHFLEGAIKHILWADIVITEQANRHVHNYFLIFASFFRKKSFAYWGHGVNRQGNPHSFRERFKRMLAIQTDWWFAYTTSVADYLQDLGFDKERVTVLNNSVDTRAFKQGLSELTDQEVANFKQQHKIAEDAKIGLFCGSLHKDKKIGFLLESAKLIRQHNPKFVLLIGGDGQDKPQVEQYARQYDFIVYLGALHGEKKSLAFKSADVFLNPGMVGLAILDAFSASLPVFTTKQAEHSPEIDYLQDGYNGMMADLNSEDYANLVMSVLESETIIAELKKNALESSEKFSIENMTNNFVAGIRLFISNPHR